ncbi:MAG: demethylmenaquinone methyltransferase / 2-methoxy-6-polyprenyl,4-benzoquinol methylase [Verrucomicrobiota bacterium]
MANPFYQPGEHRSEKVNDLFGAIAPRYDRINDLQSFGLHRLWKRQLIRLANPKVGEHALDLCCGTGDIAFALATKGAQVVGIDFSEPMLQVARRRIKQRSPEALPPKFLQGDAQQIPFPDESFEIVTIGYGLRNLSSWETGLREMIRVARPGGRLLILDFGKPDNALWRIFYFGYLKWFVPVFGKIFCGNSAAYSYILESLKHYPAQHGVAVKLRELGLINVRVLNLLGGIMSIHYAEKA